MEKRIKVGIVGCGAIGSSVARYCAEELSDAIILKAFFDIDRNKAAALKSGLSGNILIAASIGQVAKESDLIVETASIDAAPQVLEKAIEAKKDAMIISSGGIVDRRDLFHLARKNNCRVYIPSGAIFGLDGIKAAALRRIDEAILTTRKPKDALRGAPYIEKRGIDLDSVKTEEKIFEGSAEEAIEAFPKNINVSASLSLAGIGAKKTKVRIICAPAGKNNIHEIELKGEFGMFFVRAENVPLPNNPKTSFLAALSAMATIRGIVDSVRIGT